MSRHQTPVTWLTRAAFVLLVLSCLVSGISGGLLRAGVPLAGWLPPDLMIPVVFLHAALMICGFLGTVIGIERAVALKAAWAFGVPLASGAGSLCLLTGHLAWGAPCLVIASLLFVVVNGLIVRRQAATHTWLLLLSAVVWLGGNVRFWLEGVQDSTLQAWFGFLVLTIAAERLEMARLMRRRRGAGMLLAATVALLSLSILLADHLPVSSGIAFGVALSALALWLAVFDVARHTVRAAGLSRYMAICLLTGYAWLAISGVCWSAHAAGWHSRDASLHALGLGFIISMVMGHAPVILPAVAGVKLHFDARFYLPLSVFHLSLIIRLLPGYVDPGMLAVGSGLNAVSIGLFALTVISAAISWRRRHPVTAGRPRSRSVT
jgi:hypothetical protein